MNQEIISERISETIQMLRMVSNNLTAEIDQAARMITAALQKGGKVMFFGNGGSAADAQHLAAEFVGRYQLSRSALAAIALTTNTSILTAVANDFGYEQVFARQVEALGQPEDVFVGLSTSGSSPNVVLAINLARQLGGATIAFTGMKSCKLDRVADLSLKIPSSDTPRIQEGHIVVGHVICGLVEQALLKETEE